MKNLRNLVRKTGKKTEYWLRIETRFLVALDQKLEYDIYNWGHKKYRCFFNTAP